MHLGPAHQLCWLQCGVLGRYSTFKIMFHMLLLLFLLFLLLLLLLLYFFVQCYYKKQVLFQFLCNVQQCCDSDYNKLNSHKQKEFINITKLRCIGGWGGWGGIEETERETHTHTHTHTTTTMFQMLSLTQDSTSERNGPNLRLTLI